MSLVSDVDEHETSFTSVVLICVPRRAHLP